MPWLAGIARCWRQVAAGEVVFPEALGDHGGTVDQHHGDQAGELVAVDQAGTVFTTT